MTNPYLDSCQGKALGVLLLVFVGGAASGVVGTLAYNQIADPGEPVVTVPPAAPPSAKIAELAVEHLQDELELDSEQMTRVRSVLDQCIMRQADMYWEIRNLQSQGREQILEILNENQRAKFETLLHQTATQ